MPEVIKTRIQLRRQTTAYWEEHPDFVPLIAEPVVYMDYKTVVDTNGDSVVIPGLKLGDGLTAIKDLPFIDAGSSQSPAKEWDIVYCDSAENTPNGISFGNVNGTLIASINTVGKLYFVPSENDDHDVFDEYITIKSPQGEYTWERLGGLDASNIVAKKLKHTLTFGNGGAYQFDGSADVTVPVYNGDYNLTN